MANKEKIIKNVDGSLNVPDHPIIPFIEGDGIGPDIWQAARLVMDKAVEKAFSGQRQIEWLEVPAGEKSFRDTGTWLPDATLEEIEAHVVAIKGPLTVEVFKDNKIGLPFYERYGFVVTGEGVFDASGDETFKMAMPGS